MWEVENAETWFKMLNLLGTGQYLWTFSNFSFMGFKNSLRRRYGANTVCAVTPRKTNVVSQNPIFSGQDGRFGEDFPLAATL